MNSKHEETGFPTFDAKESWDRIFAFLEALFGPTGAKIKKNSDRKFSVTTLDGGTVTVTPNRITYEGVSNSDHATHRATALLIREMGWSSAVASGPLSFQRTRVAYGRVYEVNITARDEAMFTSADWKWVEAKERQLRALESRNRPFRPRPGRRPSGQSNQAGAPPL
jgi:hypothetical protein